MPLKTSVLPLLACILLSCASQSESEEPLLTPASRTTPAAERAIGSIAAARCDHEQRCKGIGPNRVYVNGEHCMRVMLEDAKSELRACRLGIDQPDLMECLAAIHDGGCGGMLATLEQVGACRSAELCVD